MRCIATILLRPVQTPTFGPHGSLAPSAVRVLTLHAQCWATTTKCRPPSPPAERLLLETADLVLSVDAAEADAGSQLSSLVGTRGDATWTSTENPAVSVKLTSAGGPGGAAWVGRWLAGWLVRGRHMHAAQLGGAPAPAGG